MEAKQSSSDTKKKSRDRDPCPVCDFDLYYNSDATQRIGIINVKREVLDQQESQGRASEIRAVQSSYKAARQEIDWILNNLDALQEGSVNTQYHGSVSR